MRLFLCAILLSSISILYSQSMEGMELVAHYPLSENANDITGNNANMTLTNTPFQDGGIYCNGINTESENGCDAFTPFIDQLNLDHFIITLKFKLLDLDIAEQVVRPVITCGYGWRWMGITILNDSILYSHYNNTIGNPLIKMQTDIWYEVTMYYNRDTQNGKWYLDNTLLDSTIFDLKHGNGKEMGITNNGMGKNFKGIIKDLKVYSGTTTSISNHQAPLNSYYILAQNYPNPFNPETTIEYSVPQATDMNIDIYNTKGQLIRTLLKSHVKTGHFSIVWDSNDNYGQPVSSGIYIVKFTAENYNKSLKISLVR